MTTERPTQDEFEQAWQRRQDEALERSFAGVSDRVLRRIMADINALPERTPKLTFRTIGRDKRMACLDRFYKLSQRIYALGFDPAIQPNRAHRDRLIRASYQLQRYIAGDAS